MDDNMEVSIEKFLKAVFKSNPNYDSLTKAELRNRYLKDQNLTEFSKAEKKLFSSVVNKVILEFADDIEQKNKCDESVEKNSDASKSDSDEKSGPMKSEGEVENNFAVPGEESSEQKKEVKGKFPSYNGKKSGSESDTESSDSEALVIAQSPVAHSQSEMSEKESAETLQAGSTSNTCPKKDDVEKQKKEISSSDMDSEDDMAFKKKGKKPIQTKPPVLKPTISEIATNENLSDAGAASAGNRTSDEKENIISKKSGPKKRKRPSREPKRRKPIRKHIKLTIDKRIINSSSSSASDEEDYYFTSHVEMPRINTLPTVTPKAIAATNKSKPEMCSDDGDNKNEEEGEEKVASSARSGEEESDENDKTKKNKKPSSSDPKGKQKSSTMNTKIENLKKYIRATGLRIQSYEKVFEKCHSLKAKADKLIEILQNEGLKGRPTLQKCKKLKKAIEERKEIESLDVTNIIETEQGRPKRNARSLYLSSYSASKETEAHCADDDFSNLKDIIGSDDSDTPVKKFSRVQNLSDSEEN